MEDIMGDHLVWERYFWFDKQVRTEKFPNARNLAERFEISTKTAQRNIDFMRDRIGAPLEYIPSYRGYNYNDKSFSLHSFQVSQEELISILISRDLLSNSAEGIISQTIQSFGKKLMTTMGEIGFEEEKLQNAFSTVWNGHSPSKSETFQTVTNGLLENRILTCNYTSPASGQKTKRRIAPHHLQHYMGSWVLIGWCELRQDWRKFFLSRITDASLTEEKFIPKPIEEWEPLIHSSFGIFQGDRRVPVVLHFTPFRAKWIKEQIWHPAQEMEELPDGSLKLIFPVSDFREVKLKILQFGSDVEVIEPAELREEVKQEIKKMVKIYETGEL